MCGIAGLIYKTTVHESRVADFIKSSDLMHHRGPDHKGIFREGNILFIHFRLSIIDLDPRAHQPMVSHDGNSFMVYNGELYNYKALQSQYAVNVRTSSDSEVLLETFVQSDGKAVEQWNGIFAAAIFNKVDSKIHLIRDRFGVKPLYVYEDEEVFAFSSEAKVILHWLDNFSLDKTALAQFTWFGNTTGAATQIKGMRRLEPGYIKTIDTNTFQKDSRSYWSEENIEPFCGTIHEAIHTTRELLEKAVSNQLIADVPVGVLLSGGIDSSSIVAFASKHYNGQLDTYSAAYDYNIGGKSELEKARIIANQFNTNHHELEVTTNDVVDTFSDLVYQYDEPFADPASIPLFQLAKACSKDKRVILQGDGGDEMFAGYRRYNVMNDFWFWRLTSKTSPVLPSAHWRERMKRVDFILGQKEFGNLLSYYMTEEVPYKHPYQIFDPSFQTELEGTNWKVDYNEVARRFSRLDRVQQLLYADAVILLPGRYLEKVDKATMLNSIEARVPFLDNDLAAFAMSLPSSMKVKRGQKKYVLKKALEGIAPNDILYGPKRGFDVPFREWLRQDLYDFAMDSFSSHKLGILDKKRLSELLKIHRNRQADYATLLWKSLVLCHWLEVYEKKIAL